MTGSPGGDGLGDPVVLQRGFAWSGSGDEFLEDEQVPLLVVLLNPAFCDPFVDTPGEAGVSMDVGDGDVGDLFPALIGHPGDELEHLEFRQGAPAPVEQVHGREEQPGRDAGPAARRGQRLLLCREQLGAGQLGRLGGRPRGGRQVTRGWFLVLFRGGGPPVISAGRQVCRRLGFGGLAWHSQISPAAVSAALVSSWFRPASVCSKSARVPVRWARNPSRISSPPASAWSSHSAPTRAWVARRGSASMW